MPAKSSNPLSATVGAYLRVQPKQARDVLRQVRATLIAALPDAEEVIRYQIPGLVLQGKLVLSFAAWKKHYAVYPFSSAISERLGASFLRAKESQV